MTKPAFASVVSTSALGRALPLRACHLYAEAQGGVSRMVLEQRFENPHDEPLHVTYVLPLPHEAAVSAFSFTLGERTIEGEIDTKGNARERFDDAIASGHTAALLEEERSTVFTQELGNVPPRTEVVARITIDALLPYVSLPGRGQWELRFPLTVAPRYLGETGRVPDAARLAVDVHEVSAETPRASLSLVVRDGLPEGRSPESASHALQCARSGSAFEVSFGGDGRAPLDRDVVVRWDAATLRPFASASAHVSEAEDAAYALVTVVPPIATNVASHPRDLTVLLDTSGSMGGEPLAQAKRFAKALVSSLREADNVHLVEFSNDTRSFKTAATSADASTKKAALAWIESLRASGGTEMRSGILRALRDVRPGRHAQVVLVTDGLIGFEHEIVSAIFRDNAHAARVHTVGVGSAVNRSLLAPAARAGRGIEIVCGVGEDVEPLVARLLARTNAPVVTDLSVKRVMPAGDLDVACAIEKLPDLYAGAPVLIPVRLPREGGTIVLRGRTSFGDFYQEISVVADGVARPNVRVLYGREAVLDVEMRVGAGEYSRDADAEIERLGLSYGIATRMTSFVAVDTIRTVDPTKPTRRESVSQALPFGMTAEGAGLRPASAVMPVASATSVGRRAEASSSLPPPPRSAPLGGPPAGGAPAPKASAPIAPPAQASSSDGSGFAGAPRRARTAGPETMEKRAKKEVPGLLERAIRTVFGAKADADDFADEGAIAPSEAESELAKSEEQPMLSLVGRLKKLDGNSFTIEVTLAFEIELAHGGPFLLLATGERLAVVLDVTRSTAPGTYGAGMVLRFVGTVQGLAPSRDAIRALEVEGPFGALVFRLS
jgi:Ca-activated chloride channel homolog